MQSIAISPDPKPPTRDLPQSVSLPTALPPAKKTKLHPTAGGEENASLYFVGTATTIMCVLLQYPVKN